jgi:hypothetical protein
MPFEAICPACQKAHRLADTLNGKTIRCKGCGDPFKATIQDDDYEEDADDRPQPTKTEGSKEKAAAGKGAMKKVEPELAEEPKSKPSSKNAEKTKRPRAVKPTKASPVTLVAIVGGIGFALIMLCGGGAVGIWFLYNSGNSAKDVEFAGTWPEPREPAGNHPHPVIFHITNITDNYTKEEVADKISALADPAPQMGSYGAKDKDSPRMTMVMYPCADPAACAKKVDFGEVRSVRGNVISVIARKAAGPAGNDKLSIAVYYMKSSSQMKRTNALRDLQQITPNERRAEVVGMLVGMLKEKDKEIRGGAADALAVWGSKENVPALLAALLDKTKFSGLDRVMRTLGKFKDERAVEPLAAWLEDAGDRGSAAEALKEMGPMAETAVLARLNHPDDQTKTAACNVLRVIGTRQSLPALEKLASHPDFNVSQTAKDTIKILAAK